MKSDSFVKIKCVRIPLPLLQRLKKLLLEYGELHSRIPIENGVELIYTFPENKTNKIFPAHNVLIGDRRPPLYRGSPGTHRKLKIKSENKVMPRFSDTCAIELYNILSKNNKIMRTPKIRLWGEEFNQLRRSGVPKEKIIEVLQWYARHIRDTFTPKAYSARAFRDKFTRILDQMEIYTKDRTKIVKDKDPDDAGIESFPDWEDNQDKGMTLEEWKSLPSHLRKQIERPQE